MSTVTSDRLWRAAYRRAVRSAFRTVPLYRERWALDGRTDPVLVAGRTGADGGAVAAAEIWRRLADVVPLAGGTREPDPLRGVRRVIAMDRLAGRGDLVFVLDDDRPQDRTDGLRRERICRPDELGFLTGASQRSAVVVGTPERLAGIHDGLRARLRVVPSLGLDRLSEVEGQRGVLHDPLLGFLGALRRCGGWHLDWPRVYARETTAGLAMTLLWQRSPRLVDVLACGGVKGVLDRCPEHGTPVVRT